MPYLLVLQHDVVAFTDTVIVAALTPHIWPVQSRLYPTFEVAGRAHTLLTPDLASLPRLALKEHVINLEDQWARIVAAIDVLFTGI